MKKTNIHNRCAAVAVGSHSDCGLKQLLGMRVLLDIQKLSSVNEILKFENAYLVCCYQYQFTRNDCVVKKGFF